MKKATIIVVLVFLMAGVASIATIHYMDDERAAKAATTKPAEMVTTKIVDLGDGRYIKYVEFGGRQYAGVVINHPANDPSTQAKPVSYRNIARNLLQDDDPDKNWVYATTSESSGKEGDCYYAVFILKTSKESQDEWDVMLGLKTSLDFHKPVTTRPEK